MGNKTDQRSHDHAITSVKVIGWVLLSSALVTTALVYVRGWHPFLLIAALPGVGLGLVLLAASSISAKSDDPSRPIGMLVVLALLGGMAAFVAIYSGLFSEGRVIELCVDGVCESTSVRAPHDWNLSRWVAGSVSALFLALSAPLVRLASPRRATHIGAIAAAAMIWGSFVGLALDVVREDHRIRAAACERVSVELGVPTDPDLCARSER